MSEISRKTLFALPRISSSPYLQVNIFKSIIRRKYINLYISICLLLFTLSKISVKGRKPGITLVLVRTNDLTSKVKAIIKVRKSAITVEEMDRKDEIKLNFQEL